MNTSKRVKLYPQLLDYVKKLSSAYDNIPAERKVLLQKFSKYLQQKIDDQQLVQLNFICTHNSRRSHISQIWAAAAVAYYGFEQVKTYSGGTEATAFNPRAVAAMQRAGFEIPEETGNNPRYRVHFSSEIPALVCFSKKYDDDFNPSSDFAAIMTCSHADENCPFIPGVSFRLSLTYEDPKVADDTPQEQAIYDERVLEIGTEIFYAFSQLTSNL